MSKTENNLTVSVIIPTLKRPDYLKICVEALKTQTRLPDEIVIIARYDDYKTLETIELLKSTSPIPIISSTVKNPGHLPPLEEGIRIHTGEIVCFLDDDCEPLNNWLEKMLGHFNSNDVGAAGGRYITMENGLEKNYPPAKKVGAISWYGKLYGNFYRKCTRTEPFEVSSLIGGNMAYRSNVLKMIDVYMPLNINVAHGYEFDWGLQVKNLGFKIIYDPKIQAKHYTAPRDTKGLRSLNKEASYAYSHNIVLLYMRHLGICKKFISLMYFFIIGDRTSWGIMLAILDSILHFRFSWKGQLLASYRGKLAGIFSYFKSPPSKTYLLITKNYPPVTCGVGDYTYQLAKRLLKLHDKIKVLTQKHVGVESNDITAMPLVESFTLFQIPKIFKTIKLTNPQSINVQYVAQITGRFGFSISTGILILLLRILSKTNLIITFHELFIPIGKNIFLWPVALIQRINFLLLGIFSHHLLATSEAREKTLLTIFSKRKVSLLPVGSNIPVDTIHNDLKSSMKSKFVKSGEILFSTFGTASRSKNYLGIIKLISALNINGFPCSLVMIGNIQSDLKVLDRIKKEIESNNLKDKVHLTGKLEPMKVSHLLQLSDYFIINHFGGVSSGSGTLITAMAHSVPVIANRGENTPAIFVDKKNICFMDVEPAQEKAIKLIELLSDKETIGNIISGIKYTYENHFSWDVIANKIYSTGNLK